jgi:hypothetical protein
VSTDQRVVWCFVACSLRTDVGGNWRCACYVPVGVNTYNPPENMAHETRRVVITPADAFLRPSTRVQAAVVARSSGSAIDDTSTEFSVTCLGHAGGLPVVVVHAASPVAELWRAQPEPLFALITAYHRQLKAAACNAVPLAAKSASNLWIHGIASPTSALPALQPVAPADTDALLARLAAASYGGTANADCIDIRTVATGIACAALSLLPGLEPHVISAAVRATVVSCIQPATAQLQRLRQPVDKRAAVDRGVLLWHEVYSALCAACDVECLLPSGRIEADLVAAMRSAAETKELTRTSDGAAEPHASRILAVLLSAVRTRQGDADALVSKIVENAIAAEPIDERALKSRPQSTASSRRCMSSTLRVATKLMRPMSAGGAARYDTASVQLTSAERSSSSGLVTLRDRLKARLDASRNTPPSPHASTLVTESTCSATAAPATPEVPVLFRVPKLNKEKTALDLGRTRLTRSDAVSAVDLASAPLQAGRRAYHGWTREPNAMGRVVKIGLPIGARPSYRPPSDSAAGWREYDDFADALGHCNLTDDERLELTRQHKRFGIPVRHVGELASRPV